MGYIVRFLVLAAASSLAIGLTRHDGFAPSLKEAARVFGGMIAGMGALAVGVYLASAF